MRQQGHQSCCSRATCCSLSSCRSPRTFLRRLQLHMQSTCQPQQNGTTANCTRWLVMKNRARGQHTILLWSTVNHTAAGARLVSPLSCQWCTDAELNSPSAAPDQHNNTHTEAVNTHISDATKHTTPSAVSCCWMPHKHNTRAHQQAGP